MNRSITVGQRIEYKMFVKLIFLFISIVFFENWYFFDTPKPKNCVPTN